MRDAVKMRADKFDNRQHGVPSAVQRSLRAVVDIALALHFAAAAFWWWLSPQGFAFGRPARFAYLDNDGSFHVCEATSGEKGPFRVLATGRLDRGEPLEIGFYDERKRVGEITLYDWSAQLSTALSPSAGWGVPVNAIEFQRLGDEPSAECSIWITLAATAVGRGFETVGHHAGTYRNRLTLLRESVPAE